LLINGAQVATVNFELDVEFMVKAVVVTVRNGHLVSLHAEACDVAATLVVDDVQLASRLARLELPLVIRLPVLLRPGVDDDPPPPSRAKHPPAGPSRRHRTRGDLIPLRRHDEGTPPDPPRPG
jgi:hypothetical protein